MDNIIAKLSEILNEKCVQDIKDTLVKHVEETVAAQVVAEKAKLEDAFKTHFMSFFNK